MFLDAGRSVLLTREGKGVLNSILFRTGRSPLLHFSRWKENGVFKAPFFARHEKPLRSAILKKRRCIRLAVKLSRFRKTCDFSGWSQTEQKAYRTSGNNKAVVKAFDVRRKSYAVVASFSAFATRGFTLRTRSCRGRQAKHIYIFDSTTKEKKEVLALAGEIGGKCFLAPDKSKILSTCMPRDTT